MVRIISIPSEWKLGIGSTAYSGLVAGYHIKDLKPLKRFDPKYQQRLAKRRKPPRRERKATDDGIALVYAPKKLVIGTPISQ